MRITFIIVVIIITTTKNRFKIFLSNAADETQDSILWNDSESRGEDASSSEHYSACED